VSKEKVVDVPWLEWPWQRTSVESGENGSARGGMGARIGQAPGVRITRLGIGITSRWLALRYQHWLAFTHCRPMPSGSLPPRCRVPGHTHETNKAVIAADGDSAAARSCLRRHCLGLPLPTAGQSPVDRYYQTRPVPTSRQAANQVYSPALAQATQATSEAGADALEYASLNRRLDDAPRSMSRHSVTN
jgi:hypothetical protein